MKKLILLSLLLQLTTNTYSQKINVWLTQGNQNKLLEKQNDFDMSNSAVQNPSITINENDSRQVITGFGFMLNQGSAEVISKLPENEQDNLLKELYGSENGINNSIIRISIGASDLSSSVYSYNEVDGDTLMSNFSLDGPDKTYLIPLLKKILQLNPNIKILATPWSAPTWMKTNKDWIGGQLDSKYYDAYARYFVKYLEEMEKEGISIWGITPQNEPLNDHNEPSMFMEANQQIDFINNHLGKAIKNAGYDTKIIAYDHNCDELQYPIKVLNESNYVDGAAFHLYDPGANIAGMSEVRNATNKNIYFTEQFTSSNGSFDGDFGWHTENIVIGALRNWSKTVIEWNLATNENFGPFTNGGCKECQGAFTIANNNTLTRNVSYYIIGQVSKFVQPNATILNTNNDILNVAFKNPNGERVLLVYNISSDADRFISVNWNNKSFEYNIPKRTSATFVWPLETDTTLSTNEFINKNENVVFPNPADHKLHIKLNTKSAKSVQLFNIAGQNIYNKNINESSNFINTQNFNNGIYFLKIIDNKKQTIKILKVAIQH